MSVQPGNCGIFGFSPGIVLSCCGVLLGGKLDARYISNAGSWNEGGFGKS